MRLKRDHAELLAYLLQSTKIVSVQELMQHFAVSRASVYRTIDRINDAASLEIARIRKEPVVLNKDTLREVLQERKKLTDQLLRQLG